MGRAGDGGAQGKEKSSIRWGGGIGPAREEPGGPGTGHPDAKDSGARPGFWDTPVARESPSLSPLRDAEGLLGAQGKEQEPQKAEGKGEGRGWRLEKGSCHPGTYNHVFGIRSK